MKKVILFETNDTHFLLPLSYYKHCAELKVGIFSIEEKWTRAGFKVEKTGRYYLNKDSLSDAGEYLYVSARLLPDADNFNLIHKLKLNQALSLNNQLVAFRTDRQATRDAGGFTIVNKSDFNVIKIQESRYLAYPWDIVAFNADEIKVDSKRFLQHKKTNFKNVTLVNESKIVIESNVSISAGVVINAENGPVIIDSDAVIKANSYLEGPLYIGKHTEIKPLAKIYNSSIHHTCKAGGEISGSIMLEYCNKGHDGFLGSSILGSWTNIGAGSNTSNLKNNYSEVVMTYFGERIKSGTQYLGTILGDHSKAAIQTRFNTGTIVGVQSNIFEAGIPPKWIASFSWGPDGNISHDLEKSIETSRIVMSRRNVNFDDKMQALFKAVHKTCKKIEQL